MKPVPQGYPVTRPVMKIFMGNDRFNTLIIRIGGSFRTGQHIFGVENVEAFVFHGPHVETVSRDNHVAIQIIFAPVNLFIPAHGSLEAFHGLIAGSQVPFGHINFQRH